ncbi:hypothetical protein B0H13DRAFT_2315734 [Mycena leptocephala]|nr:hypothetical protein B0H13DRAFT_2315734 [Mycena leptocephala]
MSTSHQVSISVYQRFHVDSVQLPAQLPTSSHLPSIPEGQPELPRGLPAHHYLTALAALPFLQHLGLRVHERVRKADYDLAPISVFPASKFSSALTALAFLTRAPLTDVHILLWGERPERHPLGSQDWDDPYVEAPADIFVEYRFRRGGKSEGGVGSLRRFAMVEVRGSDGDEPYRRRHGVREGPGVAALYRLRGTFTERVGGSMDG